MGAVIRNLRMPAIVSAMLVLPFMVLEAVNRRRFDDDLPAALFVVMWLLLFLFGGTLLTRPRGRVLLAAKLVGLLAIGSIWVSLVFDQLPCFLGVPNCD
jgi:hypothetical protein